VHEATWPAGSQRDWLDTWWADALSTSAEQLRSGGVVVTDRLDHVGVLQLCHGDGAVVYVALAPGSTPPGCWMRTSRSPCSTTLCVPNEKV